MKATHVAVLVGLVLPGAAALAQSAQATSPYAGQQSRRIKAMSEDEVQGYLDGRGVGLALPAELNHYPGPRHALDLADSLKLTATQRKQFRDIYDPMHARALVLGRQLVDIETAIDSAFATRQMTAPKLGKLLRESARVTGELRLTHLEAHLRVFPLLTPAQVKEYDRLRGYDGATVHNHTGHEP